MPVRQLPQLLGQRALALQGVQLPVSAAKRPPPSPISQTRLPLFLPCPHPPCSGAEEGSDEEMSSDEESLASEGEEESEYEAESDEEEGEAQAEAGGHGEQRAV